MSSRPELTYDVAYPERLSRLLVLVKTLLALPHYLLLSVFQAVTGVITFIAWFAILFTGKYPESLWRFSLGYYRYSTNVNAYTWLQRDEYPPFGDSRYEPVTFELAYPTHLSRLLIFVKAFLLIPHFIVLMLLGFVMLLVVMVAALVILITGQVPRGTFDMITGVQRWGLRVNLYANLMTDAYPPFTMAPTAGTNEPRPALAGTY